MTADGVLYDIQTTQNIPFRNGVFAFSHVRHVASQVSMKTLANQQRFEWLNIWKNVENDGRLLANPECTTQTILTFRKSLLVCFVWTLYKLIKQ